MKIEKSLKDDNENIKNELKELKQSFEVYLINEIKLDMNSLCNKKDIEVEEKTKIIQNLINELNNEFGKIHDKVIINLIFHRLKVKYKIKVQVRTNFFHR